MAWMMDPAGGGYDRYGMMGYGRPFAGGGMILVWLIVFGIIGSIVYPDANRKGMHGLLWWILILIPMVGIFALFLYIVIRDLRHHGARETKTPMDILKERYAKGELTGEQSRKMSEDLKQERFPQRGGNHRPPGTGACPDGPKPPTGCRLQRVRHRGTPYPAPKISSCRKPSFPRVRNTRKQNTLLLLE
jgi:putative membrane protein